MVRTRSMHGDMRNLYKILVEIPEGKKLLERHGRGWEDNIKAGLKETGYECVYWIQVA